MKMTVVKRGAAVSQCGKHRYWLERTIQAPDRRKLTMIVVNLWSFRATDPRDLLKAVKAGEGYGPEIGEYMQRAIAASRKPFHVVWVMLNPSIADFKIDDPTIRRCVGFSGRWLEAGHLDRHPAVQTGPYAPPGRRGILVLAWGAHGWYGSADYTFYDMLGSEAESHGDPLPMHLGFTAEGDHPAQPRHPLMLPYTTELTLLNREMYIA